MARKILSINRIDDHFNQHWRGCEVRNVVKDFSRSMTLNPKYPRGFIGCRCDVLDHDERWHNDTCFYCVKLSK